MTRKLFALGTILVVSFLLYAQGNKSVTINGYLIDNACANGHVKEATFRERVKKHKTSCALTPNCAASGFAVFTEEGKLYKLDAVGNKSAEEMLKNTDTEIGVQVAVEGTLEGETIRVTKISETTKTS